jgi:Tfp pilus assembly protein PilN
MRAIHLDYQRTYRPFPTLGVVLLLAALGIGAQLARQYEYLSGVFEGWEALEKRVDRLARQHDVRLGERGNPDAEQRAREVTKANEVLRRITLPWDDLFAAVESAAPGEVALLTMEPDAEKRLLKVSGEAKHVAAMFDYIRTLEGRPMFESVTLSNHQEQVTDPQRPVRFSLVAAWRETP